MARVPASFSPHFAESPGHGQEHLENIAVIIPTLNAAATLPAALAAIGPGPAIIIADGGSTDATRALATTAGAQVISAPRGRGPQLATGIAASASPWLLLLHADTRLDPAWREAASTHIATHPDQAGYFRLALDSPHPAARRLERLVAWRCRVLALPYGDQGLLIPRALLDAIGGMRDLPLMEDVDLVRRIVRFGGRHRLAPLAATATTSAARYEREGYLRRPARNLTCLALWFLGVPMRVLTRLYG
jgi:rSAM/selenodomain-associated transferase 2